MRTFTYCMLFLLAGLSALAPARAGEKTPKKTVEGDFSLELPRAEQLFQVQSEEALRQRIRADALKRGIKNTQFPQDARPAAKAIDFAQLYPGQTIPAPACAICYRTLYFEDVTRERDLRSWHVVEPLREGICFYGTALALPAAMLVTPPWRYQCWVYPFNP